VKITQVETYNDFVALKEEWHNTLERCNHRVFSTWEWLSTWWKYFGNNKKLLLLLAQENGKILGIAPLMYSVQSTFGLRMGKIEFIGTPESDYSEFILVEKGQECVKQFIDYILASVTESWDCIELAEIPETAGSLNHLKVLHNGTRVMQIQVSNECPYVPIVNSFDDFFNKLSSKFRKNLRRSIRQLKERHVLEFRKHSGQRDLEDSMNTMFSLHQKRWITRGWPGVFGDPRVRDFHLEIARSFSRRGWMSISSLVADGIDIASLYGFNYKSRFYANLTGMDPAYEKYGVGNLLYLNMLEDCFKEKLAEFDFMRGKEMYKYRWNSSIRSNFEVVLVRDEFLSWLQNWLSRKYSYQVNRLTYFLRLARGIRYPTAMKKKKLRLL